MTGTTGIELGPDTCVLAGVRTTRSGAEIVALHTIEPASWPAHDSVLADVLRDVRKSKKFPRRARVVAWGIPEDATPETVSRAAMRPLVEAGFTLDRIITPPQALAILAGTRVRPGAEAAGVVWLALNMHGAAIAIVRGTDLLFARTFQWTYNPHLFSSRAQLLQRYSLISQLAPEVRHGIAAVRATQGTNVDAVVTCGDLPELRSLTMPLIEELDLEVETLDSLEGLRPVGRAKLERLAESAPAIRLACAAATMGAQRGRAEWPPAARVAAAAACLAALGYGAYAYFARASSPVVPVHHTAQSTSRPPAKQGRPSSREGIPSASPASAPMPQPAPRSPELAHTESDAAVGKPENTRIVVAPARSTRSPIVSTTEPTKSQPAPPVVAAPKPVTLPPRPEAATPVSPAAAPPIPAPSLETATRTMDPAPRRQTPGAAGDTRGVVFPQPRTSSRPAPLSDPVPKLDSILIDQDRRLAILDGALGGVGSQVGQRVIVQIERDAVVLREPSGVLVRVPLRSRE
jgi:hypothetical protein